MSAERTVNNTGNAPPSRDRPPRLETRLKDAATRLRDAMRAVVDQLRRDETYHQQAGFMRALKVSQPVASRVLASIRLNDPLAAVQAMPGPQGLRQVLQAASRAGVTQPTIREAESATRRFENLLRREIGGRSLLDALISGWMPETRERFELTHKQAAFKAISHLKGVMLDLHLTTFLLHPSQQPDRNDGVLIKGVLGLRRLRPGAVVHYTTRKHTAEASRLAPLTLAGKPIEDIRGLLLEPFCSTPLPRLDARRQDGCVHYTLGGNGVGLQSAVDLAFAEVARRCHPRYQPSEGYWKSGPSAEVEQPAKTLVYDVLLHDDVWPGCEPELRIYDTVVNGTGSPNDPTRDIERLDLAESIQFMGRGVERFRASEVEQYLDMIHHVCEKMGWRPEAFRGYRCRIRYPFYGSQVCMAFEPPQRPPTLS